MMNIWTIKGISGHYGFIVVNNLPFMVTILSTQTNDIISLLLIRKELRSKSEIIIFPVQQ